MSKGRRKRPIHDLTRDLPTPQDIDYIETKEFSRISDRTAAIILASVVEALLEYNILEMLPNKSIEARENLFKDNGPLATFFAKIELGFAMNIISKDAKADLSTIRRIRNAFAHARTNIDFNTEEISKECAKLKSRFPLHMIAVSMGESDPLNSREKYKEVCLMIWRAFLFEHTRIKMRRDDPTNPLLKQKYMFPPGDPSDDPQ